MTEFVVRNPGLAGLFTISTDLADKDMYGWETVPYDELFQMQKNLIYRYIFFIRAISMNRSAMKLKWKLWLKAELMSLRDISHLMLLPSLNKRNYMTKNYYK